METTSGNGIACFTNKIWQVVGGNFQCARIHGRERKKQVSVGSLASFHVKMFYYSTQSRKCMCLHAFFPHCLSVLQFQKTEGRSSLWLFSKLWSLLCSCLLPGLFFCLAGRILSATVLLELLFFIEQLKHATTGNYFQLLTQGITQDKYSQNPSEAYPLSSIIYMSVFQMDREKTKGMEMRAHSKHGTRLHWHCLVFTCMVVYYREKCWAQLGYQVKWIPVFPKLRLSFSKPYFWDGKWDKINLNTSSSFWNSEKATDWKAKCMSSTCSLSQTSMWPW